MKLLGNYGALRVGATAGGQYYWNRQWTIKYKAANATLTKTVKLTNEDLSAFYIIGTYEKGNVWLKLSQNNAELSLNLANSFNEKLDLSRFSAGVIKIVVTMDSVKNLKTTIGWRR